MANTLDEAVPGDRWQLRGEGTPWRVVSIKNNRVGLSGPGPCRGMKYVKLREFYADWRRVVDSKNEP